MLGRIQNELFDLGADLCTPEDGRRAAGALRVVPAQVTRLETEIDRMNKELEPLNSLFVLAGGQRGGGLSAPRAHGRSPRRAARVGARGRGKGEPGGAQIPEPAFRSPLRAEPPASTGNGAADVLWQPGATR